MCSPTQFENIDRGVRVSVERRAADRAGVPAFGELLFRSVAALVTVLGCIGGINGYQFTSGAFCLLREDSTKH